MESFSQNPLQMRFSSFLISCSACTLSLAMSLQMNAKEGMWIPTLLDAVENEMQAMGMHLSAEDIYSINEGSLKDAVVHFNGGCTAEMVSSEGLLLTNHHCGYGQIAYHSSVEHDYLTAGFWAMTRAEELPNPDLYARFIDRIVDVSERMRKAADAGMEKEAIVKEFTEGTDLEGSVVAFDFGNSHYLITTRTFHDVRLVGAPPSAVGKFGGDTDNWVWPRHTGDFSMFRIYADANNQPAEFSLDNVPYRPKHHFPVNIGDTQAGDFTMIFGFPGKTEQYLTSDAVVHVLDILNPMRIEMREASLAVINAARASSPALKIAYADKQSGVANSWKKWIGQSRGLKELHAVEQKQALEAEFMARAAQAGQDDEWGTLIGEIQSANEIYFPFLEGRWKFIEWVYYGPDLLNFAMGFDGLIEQAGDSETTDSTWVALRDELAGSVDEFYRQFDAEVDEDIMAALAGLYLANSPDAFQPEFMADLQNPHSFAQNIYEKSIFSKPQVLKEALASDSRKKWSKRAKDPALQLVKSTYDVYFSQIRPGYMKQREVLDSLTARYTSGLRTLFPERAFFPDANSTLRLTYGKIEGSAPYDGMAYAPFSTHKGILQKYIPGDPDFDLPLDMVQALQAEDWGAYGNSNGDLSVCFTGSNHTTGGNSGSPAINGDGHLIGINFDRSWESTMSDILFDDTRCRNIMVDIRYVLWITDVYAGAGHLVEEMTVVK